MTSWIRSVRARLPESTSVMDAIGVGLIAGMCWMIYPPLALGVVGAACLVLSWLLHR